MKKWKIAGINFDHMHMGDLLRKVHQHPSAEIVGICDENPERMRWSIDTFKIDAARVFTDFRACLERTKPDLVILCPATAEHASFTAATPCVMGQQWRAGSAGWINRNFCKRSRN